MIQRKQSLYLLISFLLSTGLVIAWKPCSEGSMATCALLLISAALSLTTIFLFKNRQLQFVLGRINIVSNLILLGLLAYATFNLPGEANPSMKGIEVLPFVSIVLIVLANKAIQKDENLVKSVDRIR